MRCCMLDIETLGIKVDSVILTLGAVYFDPYDKSQAPYDPIHIKLDIDQQTALGRTIDDDTLAWWAKKPQDIFDDAMSEDDRTSLEDFTNQLNKYVGSAKQVWAHGPIFDIVMIEHLYKMIGKPYPWSYSKIRDSRTMFDLGDASVKFGNDMAHNALADAYCQAVAVQNIYHELGIKQKS